MDIWQFDIQTIWFVYICGNFSFDIDIVLLKIVIYNNDMIHYLDITSWLLCRGLVLVIAYCFNACLRTWCIIWNKAFDNTFFLFMGGDVTYISMFIFKFTCKWPAVIKVHSSLLNSFVNKVWNFKEGVFCVQVIFFVLISLILVNKVSRLQSGYIKRTLINNGHSVNKI